MKYVKHPALALFLTIFFCISCSKDPMYNVPANIQPYIDEFLAQAAARGVDLEIEDLVVLFEENLEVNGVAAAGVCTRSRKSTPTIKLDTTTLNWTANLSAREQLIFHELGHCVLNRTHLDARLANRNYSSTMRTSGEQLYGPLLSSFKRDYYFDQLFDENAPAPSWAVDVAEYEDLPTGSRTIVMIEDFSSGPGGWNTGESAATSRKVINGRYELEVKIPDNYFVTNNYVIDEDRDFEIEVFIRVEGDGFGGVLWGGETQPGGIPTFQTMFFDDDVVSIGTVAEGTESSYSYGDFFNEGYNKVTVRRIGNDYYFFLNENRLDNMAYAGLDGNIFGLSFGGVVGVKVLVDQISLYYLD